METKTIILPNRSDNFLLRAMSELLEEGETVRMAFGGSSMLPLISGIDDKIELTPLKDGESCQPGEVYLFRINGHYVIHRLMRIEKDGTHVFRGDNCLNCERVRRENVMARLTEVEHADGSVIRCDSEEWRTASHRVVRRRTWKNYILRFLGRPNRRRLSVLYFIGLAVLMWAPLSGLGIPLNNFVLGIRLDHLLHASVYLLCPLFLMDALHYRKGRIILLSIAIGLCTEFVQYLLPYRGFDINDMVANSLGCLLGWVVLLPYLQKKKGMIRSL